MFFGLNKVGCDHLLHQFIERNFWYPAEFFFGFAGVAEREATSVGRKWRGWGF
jgi:hypothetical protein